MRFSETPISGAYVIDIEPREDERGFFARAFCGEEFRAHGLDATVAQANLSGNRKKGTIRGLHWQTEPAPERKLFRCVRGATYHVIVDVRPDSESYLRWYGLELTPASHRALYVPALCAAGYQALADDAEVLYLVSAPYQPDAERGLRYDDPAVGIEWPLPVNEVSPKDLSWPPVAVAPSGVEA
ncbi:MAG TPA: dTDP-4-dehydrorhamnose 3,5-epimerase family protein [Gaiellaceae bacterium]|nr:dTDP-4-dehydrorhamnose 3,5-epimerase family protein [Gaiellaceae bacterium]